MKSKQSGSRVSGTPLMCKDAIDKMLHRNTDLCVSGINHGCPIHPSMSFIRNAVGCLGKVL